MNKEQIYYILTPEPKNLHLDRSVLAKYLVSNCAAEKREGKLYVLENLAIEKFKTLKRFEKFCKSLASSDNFEKKFSIETRPVPELEIFIERRGRQQLVKHNIHIADSKKLSKKVNYYKLPLKELETRVVDLRKWWWNNRDSSRSLAVGRSLEEAYQALANRKKIEENPSKKQFLQSTVNAFWLDEKKDNKKEYQAPKRFEPLKLTPKFIDECGLVKSGNSWTFNPKIFREVGAEVY